MTPRRLAVKALIHQEQTGYANLVLDAELKKCTPPLDSRDAAFAARIFYTTLERLPLLDYRINQFTKKSVAKLDAPVRAVLRAGLAQALYMNVPLPAAVNESVKLTRALENPAPQHGQRRAAPRRCRRCLRGRFCRPSGPALNLLLPVPPGGQAFLCAVRGGGVPPGRRIL